jgi:uncharacterized protein
MRFLRPLALAAITIIAAAAPVAVGADPPAFSCDAADLTAAQQRICKSSTLSTLDAELVTRFMNALDISYDALGFEDQETAWYANVRDTCKNDSCLEDAYDDRIQAVEDAAAEANKRHRADAQSERGATYDGSAPISQQLGATLDQLAGTTCLRLVRSVDLGDVRDSILARECNAGPTTAKTYLFHPATGGGFTLVFNGPAGYTRTLELQDPRSRGLHRLRVQTRVGPMESTVRYLDYDGTAYRCIAQGDEHELDSTHVTYTIVTPCAAAEGVTPAKR